MSTTGQVTRSVAGTAVERRGWWLLALLTAVMVVFGLEAFFVPGSPTDVIAGSGCCNGHALSEAPPWVFDYAGELAKYLGTFMVGTGVFGLAVVFTGLRHWRRWAWYVAWYVPILFAVHAFVLGSFPFDAVTLALGLLGLLLTVRPVFLTPARPQPVGEHPESVPWADAVGAPVHRAWALSTDPPRPWPQPVVRPHGEPSPAPAGRAAPAHQRSLGAP